MSTPLNETLAAIINEEVQRRLAESDTRPYDDGLAEGRAQGRAEALAAMADALRKLTATLTHTKNSSTPIEPQVAAPTSPSPRSETSRISAPNKDQLVREYLAQNPGARYRDMSRDMHQYVATRVYALEKRGEVVKDENGGFWLKSEIGAQREPTNPNRRGSTG